MCSNHDRLRGAHLHQLQRFGVDVGIWLIECQYELMGRAAKGRSRPLSFLAVVKRKACGMEDLKTS